MASWLIRALRSRHLIPRLSETEREALEAGTVWVEADLFRGAPDFARLLREDYPWLDEREQAFLDGPVDELLGLVDDWTISRTRAIPDQVWAFLKRNGFFGLVLPERYGGRGFSSLGLSTIIGKLASRSLPLSAVVVIPNSVGPGELILEYGTEEQKERLLPRLARGEEIPCFALTEPEAGSDAASLSSKGRVFRGEDGELQLRLDWSKRYITLAPVATLIGLAVRLEDPENLLGRGPDLGITCVLVPARLPGVEIGRRHDPMGIPFPNGPIVGRGVVVPASEIIGGPARAGQGWRMLMEALSAGRSITLPGQSVGGAKMVTRVVGAYAAVRRQFGQPIGRFEGIQEPLARMAGWTYLMEAARVFTCGAVDRGRKPAIVSAVMKYQQTELVRRIVADGMDVLGGAGLCKGPRNLLAEGYVGAPIPITVEGANILTRTLIIHGQGAIRCHPYAKREIDALVAGDGGAFGRALLGHGLYFLRNLFRSALLGLSRGRLARSPVPGPTARYYRRLAWASARFAFLSDVALFGLGPRLKQRGRLTGRFADALSWMYLGFATLRRWEAEGRKEEDLPLVRWALGESLGRIQAAFDGILRNLEVPFLGPLFRGPLALWSRLNPVGGPPRDALGPAVAGIALTPGAARDRLTAGIHLPADPDEPLARLERAFLLATEAAPLVERLRRAVRAGTLPPGEPESLPREALARGVLTEDEARLVSEAAAAREDVIQVDSFSLEEYRATAAPEPGPALAGRA